MPDGGHWALWTSSRDFFKVSIVSQIETFSCLGFCIEKWNVRLIDTLRHTQKISPPVAMQFSFHVIHRHPSIITDPASTSSHLQSSSYVVNGMVFNKFQVAGRTHYARMMFRLQSPDCIVHHSEPVRSSPCEVTSACSLSQSSIRVCCFQCLREKTLLHTQCNSILE